MGGGVSGEAGAIGNGLTTWLPAFLEYLQVCSGFHYLLGRFCYFGP